jgi:hypothetical protein
LAQARLNGAVAGTERDAFTEAVRSALELLAEPEIVILVRRQHATSAWTGTVGIAGEWGGLYVAQPGGEQHVMLFPASTALDRVAEWCGLAGNSVPGAAAVTVTGAQLLEASERAAAGDTAAAASILGGGEAAGVGEAAGRLARALAAQPVAMHVSVLDARAGSRVEGTVTGWFDGGQWGLWRVPPSDGPDEPVELRLVSKADLLEEICEGFPDLRA